MTDFTKEIEHKFPTADEIEKIMREAQTMRANMMRSAFAGLWLMLQRSVERKPAAPKARHA
jgi:hypothetical protein